MQNLRYTQIRTSHFPGMIVVVQGWRTRKFDITLADPHELPSPHHKIDNPEQASGTRFYENETFIRRCLNVAI